MKMVFNPRQAEENRAWLDAHGMAWLTDARTIEAISETLEGRYEDLTMRLVAAPDGREMLEVTGTERKAATL